MRQLFYTGAQNYETTYATVSSKDVGMLLHRWLSKRIMGTYWLKVPTILWSAFICDIWPQPDTIDKWGICYTNFMKLNLKLGFQTRLLLLLY